VRHGRGGGGKNPPIDGQAVIARNPLAVRLQP